MHAAGAASLTQLSTALDAGTGGARAAVRETMDARLRAGATPALEWAELAERASEHEAAFREYQRVLAGEPDSVGALRALAVRYEERGELRKALGCAERWRELAPQELAAWRTELELLIGAEAFPRAAQLVAQAGEALGVRRAGELERRLSLSKSPTEPGGARAMSAGDADVPGPSEADAIRFCQTFSGREGVYARQWWSESGEGGYSPVREPFTPATARQHLLGVITVGIYPVRLDGTALFAVFDLDLTKHAIAEARGRSTESRRLRGLVAGEAVRLAARLTALELPPLLEDSGYKGRHLWLLFDRPIPADTVRRFGLAFVRTHPPEAREVQLEFFPKQADPGAGLGNLVKLPLGLHRRTGRLCRLLDADGVPVADPYRQLREHPRTDLAALVRAIERLDFWNDAAVDSTVTDRQHERRGQLQGRRSQTDGAAFHDELPTRTLAEIEAIPEIARLFAGCPVLRRLADQAESERRLRYEERLVLRHTLGHSFDGVAAYNYLLGRCANAGPAERLKAPLTGNPMSCPKVRRRIPDVTSRLPCNCSFEHAPDNYPNPRLHLLGPDPRPAGTDTVLPRTGPEGLQHAARQVLDLRARQTALGRDLATAERTLLAMVSAEGGTALVEGVAFHVRRGPAGLVLEFGPGAADADGAHE